MNKLSVVLAFSLNSNCSGLRMLWIWIYLFNLDCKVDVNNILFAQTSCQSDSSVICWGPSITFLFSNRFYHANIPVSRKFTVKDFFL